MNVFNFKKKSYFCLKLYKFIMKISKTKLKQIYKYFSKNKYWITALLFMVWIIFLDENNFFRIAKYHREIHKLKKQELYLKNKITIDSTRIKELNTDNKSLEKFAREQYFFHLPDEEVFQMKTIKQ